jgi:hypothetical protein
MQTLIREKSKQTADTKTGHSRARRYNVIMYETVMPESFFVVVQRCVYAVGVMRW